MGEYIMNLTLGLDIGIASVGYGIIDGNYQVIASGVRLFSEGKPAENLIRRTMRGTRRRLRRRHHRLQRMEALLVQILNIHTPEPEGNIYEMRCRGLKEKLSKEELFLAIMHLTKRRGTHFLTAEDYEEKSGEENTSELLAKQEAELDKKYVCEVQYGSFVKEGSVRGIKNRFRNKEYMKELEKLLEVQGAFYSEVLDRKDAIIKIYSSKREYFEGPGSIKSPTPYGCYRKDKDGNIIEVNLIELMRGKCTYFPDEKRIAKESYTACLFNLMNDLNNMKVAGESISPEQKEILIKAYVDVGKNITLQVVAKVSGVKKDSIAGYRIDKNNKPVFTEFKGYKAILEAYKKAEANMDGIVGERDLIDKIAEVLTKEKSVEKRKEELMKLEIEEKIANELMKLSGFTQYHSLSFKAIEMILEDLIETDKNQMQLFLGVGLKSRISENLKGTTIVFEGKDWIVSPVTRRAVNEAIKVINAARAFVQKRYQCDFANVVIEMARDKNSDEEKVRINKYQKKNEETRKDIESIVGDLRKINGKQFQIIKLLMEQDWKCAYSGAPVSFAHVMHNMLEIDHVIPRSISFDDSQGNKVAVFIGENQTKGQRTPFQYLKSGEGKISYELFKKMVGDNKNYSRKKKEMLCYEGNIQKDIWGFIGRNLVDTRYASKKVLNLLQEYFEVNGLKTKVKVITGSFTNMFRKKARLAKDREATYAHHAQDALIIAGLANTKLMKKLNGLLKKDVDLLDEKDFLICQNGQLINRDTGEIINEDDFEATRYIRFIKEIERREPKYSFKVDRKPNRALYDQQIKATRLVENERGETERYIVTKYKDIYNTTGMGNTGKKLKSKILEKPESLLMYKHDPKTFELFKQIVEAYPNSDNPFADYQKDFGIIKKYSRKGNGPAIIDVKFLEKRLGNHRPNLRQNGNNMSVYLSIKTVRVDIYLDGGVYKFVSVPYDMLKQKGLTYSIEKEKYEQAKQKKKISKMAGFQFSLYYGERFSYLKENERFEWIYSCVNNDEKNCIETKFVDRPSPGKTQGQRMITIGSKVNNLQKYHVDVLGNAYPIEREKFAWDFKL